MITPVVYVGEETREQLKSVYGTGQRGQISKITPEAIRVYAASCLYNYLVKQGSPKEQMEALGCLADDLAIPYLLREI